MAIRIQAYARVHATERPEAVAEAIKAFFPDVELEEVTTGWRCFPKDASFLAEEVQRLRIPDTVRTALLRGARDDPQRTRFWLNKQAAAVGRLNLTRGDGPLGDVEVVVEADTASELEAWIDDIAPDTTVPAYVDPGNPDPDAEAGSDGERSDP